METVDEHRYLVPTSIERRSKVGFVASAAWCGSVAMGTVLGYSAPALARLQLPESCIEVNSNVASWFGSIMAVGALLAAPLAGFLMERCGRKTVLLYSSIPFVAGWLLLAFANQVSLLLLGRTVTGFCCGLVSLTVPVYITETSPPQYRGLLGSGIQLCVTLGMFFEYSVGIPRDVSWSLLAVLSAIFPTLLLILMCFAPETPRWLLMHNRRSEAVKAILFINGSRVNAEEECQAIETKLTVNPNEKISLRELFQSHTLKLLFISLALMFFQQFNGINSFLFYTETIFKSAHSNLEPRYSTTIIGAVLVIATLISTVLMDCAGRRILLLISGSLMCISVSSLATFYYMVHTKGNSLLEEFDWVPLLCFCIFVVAFSLGYGPIPWLMMGELLPIRVRGLACSISTLFNWTCVFIVTKEYHDMLNTLQDYGTYWLYGAFCFLSCIFVILCVPETKGRTLEDIESTMIVNDNRSYSIN